MNESYLLKSDGARALYVDCAKSLPIVDYHNHLSVADIATNRQYDNLTQLWLASDPYKHRLMRICGVPEHFITGDATPYEKFEKYCEIFPRLVGNPVFDWSRMELSEIFGIHQLPCADTAYDIYHTAGEMLRTPDFSNNAILGRFTIEYQSPVSTLTDDLSLFNGITVAPSLRGDNLLLPTASLLRELDSDGITTLDAYMDLLDAKLNTFSATGCRFADHSLDDGFTFVPDDGQNDARLVRALQGTLQPHEKNALASAILHRLGLAYAKRGWTLLLHMGAKRSTSPRLARLAGPAGGYAAAGATLDIGGLCDFLGRLEADGGLPDTVLFPLNMQHQAPLAVLQGSFARDGVISKVQLGPAWWWCDHALGIRHTLDCISSFGVLSAFIGMTTDSRSILSFIRHDYFRRLLCSFLAERNESEEWGLGLTEQKEILRRICYDNVVQKIRRNEV